MKDNYIVLDLEATCVNPRSDSFQNEIIEIGACLAASDGTILDEFQTFVRPVVNPVLTDFCVGLTHITQDQVDNAPDYLSALSLFDAWISHCQNLYGPIKSWCSWGDYDRKQFQRNSRLLNVRDGDILSIPHVNLKNLYGKTVGLQKKMLGLGKALVREEMVFQGSPHRGIDDAKNAARLLPVALGIVPYKRKSHLDNNSSMGM